MRIKKIRHEHVTIVNQQLSRDSRLTWKARGIFIYLWSQSDNWDFNAKEVATHAKDGRKALDSGLNELEKFGYLKRTRKRNRLGRLGNSEWLLSDKPVKEWLKKSESPNSENRKQVPPNSGFPNLDNPTLENGNQSKHQTEVNINRSIGSSSSSYIDIYFKQIRQKPTENQIKRIKHLANQFQDELAVKLILESALDAANPSVRYAEVCLQRYIRQGKTNAEAVKKDILDFKAGNQVGMSDEPLPTIPMFKLKDNKIDGS